MIQLAHNRKQKIVQGERNEIESTGKPWYIMTKQSCCDYGMLSVHTFIQSPICSSRSSNAGTILPSAVGPTLRRRFLPSAREHGEHAYNERRRENQWKVVHEPDDKNTQGPQHLTLSMKQNNLYDGSSISLYNTFTKHNKNAENKEKNGNITPSWLIPIAADCLNKLVDE